MADVIVIGDGLIELATALEFAEVGLEIEIFPHAASVSEPAGGDAAQAGSAAPHALDDPDHAPVRDPEGTIRGLLDHLAAPITPGAAGDERLRAHETPPAPVLLRSHKGTWVPQPEPAVLGIPTVPLASSSFAVLGTAGALRAGVDRIRPVLTIGKTHELGVLVQSRLGRVARERLVDPFAWEVFGVDADQIDVIVAAPGLNEALTRVGTLSGAALDCAERIVARETRVAPAAGWAALRAALLTRLGYHNVTFADGPAEKIVPGVDDGWIVRSGATPTGVTSGRSGEVPDAQRSAQPTAAKHHARVLVLGVSHEAAPIEGSDTAALLSAPRRELGSIEIADPGLPEGAPDGPALQLLDMESGGETSVRIERRGSASARRWVATVAGPAHQTPLAARAIDQSRARVREAVIAVGETPVGNSFAHSMPVAPYATVERRETEVQGLESWIDRNQRQLPVGSALHGGELAAALVDARKRAVLLRRSLTGISE